MNNHSTSIEETISALYLEASMAALHNTLVATYCT